MNNKLECIEKIQGYDFLACYRVERDARIKIKLQALHHLQTGRKINEVAEIVLYNEKTVKVWLTRFIDYDYEGLIEKEGRGAHPRLPVEEESNFKLALNSAYEIKNGGRIIGEEIRSLLSEKFDCNYSVSGVYALLDRLNLVWISGRSKHPRHSEEVMDLFKETFPIEVQKIEGKINSKKIEIWWQDEMRVGQQGSLSRVWAEKGSRPRVVRQRQFLSTYIFGAVCPDKDKGCAVILPECNAGMVQIHLDQISEKIEKDFHCILLMDRASWHMTEVLNVPENISILALPPYSPELNPMEQVWQQLRKIKLSNTFYKDYDSIVQSCCEAWNTFCDEDGNIKNLCTRKWAT